MLLVYDDLLVRLFQNAVFTAVIILLFSVCTSYCISCVLTIWSSCFWEFLGHLKEVSFVHSRKPVEHFLKAVDEVTPKDIASTAQKLLKSPLTMASYGDGNFHDCNFLFWILSICAFVYPNVGIPLCFCSYLSSNLRFDQQQVPCEMRVDCAGLWRDLVFIVYPSLTVHIFELSLPHFWWKIREDSDSLLNNNQWNREAAVHAGDFCWRPRLPYAVKSSGLLIIFVNAHLM